MPFAGWPTAAAVGLLAGGVAGLVGIGGGAVMVPFLYFFLGHASLSGSWLFVIVFVTLGLRLSIGNLLTFTSR